MYKIKLYPVLQKLKKKDKLNCDKLLKVSILYLYHQFCVLKEMFNL